MIESQIFVDNIFSEWALDVSDKIIGLNIEIRKRQEKYCKRTDILINSLIVCCLQVFHY